MYKDKFIAFIDILGFNEIIKNDKIPLDEILAILENFSMKSEFKEGKYIPFTSLCPSSEKIKADFDLCSIQISDSLIVSSEVSIASVINLLFLCKRSIFKLAQYGLLCRGYITRGEVHHTHNQIIGKGYIEAYINEGKYPFPYTRIDEKVYAYIFESRDESAIKMFTSLTKTIDTDIVLFTLHNMVYTSAIGSETNLEDDKKEIDLIIGELENLKTLTRRYIDFEIPSVVEKWEEYERMIDEKIAVNIDAKESIDRLSRPFFMKLFRKK